MTGEASELLVHHHSPHTVLAEGLCPGAPRPVPLAPGPVLEAERHPHLKLLPAVVLHAEDEDEGGEGAVLVVVREAGGDLPADLPHTNLQSDCSSPGQRLTTSCP